MSQEQRIGEDAESETFDVVVVGSGAGGLMAALVATCNGLSTCVIEKTEQLGGTTATSGGTIWVPGNPKGLSKSSPDSMDAIRTYLDGEIGPGDRELRAAFLAAVDPMLAFLEANSDLRLTMNDPYPDYHSEEAGAVMSGRALTPLPFDGSKLGAFLKRIRPPIREFMILGGMMVGRNEIPSLVRPWSSVRALRTSMSLVSRYVLDRMVAPRGRRLYLGNALVAALADAVRRRGGQFRFGFDLEELIAEQGQVRGVRCSTPHGATTIQSRKAVVLATGGFSSNPDLFRKLTGLDVTRGSGAFRENRGSGIEAALGAGAALDDNHKSGAFWMPVSVLKRTEHDITFYPHIRDRPKPGLICVAQDGRRFVNESASYHDVCQAMLARLKTEPHSRFYLVCDRPFIWNYGLGMINPVWQRLAYYLVRNYLHAAPTLDALAAKLKIDASALSATVARHNGFAVTGTDEDFGKGSTRYNRFNGDASVKPNPCLAPIRTAPFYAVEVFPAPIGTSTGLKTDVDGRVLSQSGAVIEGLYAAGNDMSSIMRGSYPGPGITLGPHLAFAYRAATRMSEDLGNSAAAFTASEAERGKL